MQWSIINKMENSMSSSNHYQNLSFRIKLDILSKDEYDSTSRVSSFEEEMSKYVNDQTTYSLGLNKNDNLAPDVEEILRAASAASYNTLLSKLENDPKWDEGLAKKFISNLNLLCIRYVKQLPSGDIEQKGGSQQLGNQPDQPII